MSIEKAFGTLSEGDGRVLRRTLQGISTHVDAAESLHSIRRPAATEAADAMAGALESAFRCYAVRDQLAALPTVPVCRRGT
jgi:hypothetical protein